MATYTMPLRHYIEGFTQYEEGLSLNEKIEVGRTKLFDFNYPIFDSDYKKVFETNFIKNFYIREIGFETEGLFKMRLETWLNINMPYFNKMFESEMIKYDPLVNTFMDTEREMENKKDRKDDRNISQNSETDGTTDSNMNQDSNTNNQSNQNQNTKSNTENVEDNFGRKVSSDNPDSRLQLQTEEGKGVIEYASDIEENKVNNKDTSNTTGNTSTVSDSSGQANTKTDATDISHVESTAEQADKLNSNIDEVEKFIEKRTGKIGIDSQAKLIQDYRSSLLRIELQIHSEMQELFMLVY